MFFVVFPYCVFHIARFNKDNIRQHPTLMLPQKRQRESIRQKHSAWSFASQKDIFSMEYFVYFEEK